MGVGVRRRPGPTQGQLDSIRVNYSELYDTHVCPGQRCLLLGFKRSTLALLMMLQKRVGFRVEGR